MTEYESLGDLIAMNVRCAETGALRDPAAAFRWAGLEEKTGIIGLGRQAFAQHERSMSRPRLPR